MLALLQGLAIIAVTLPLSIGATIAGQWRATQPVFFGISKLWGRLVLRIARVSLTVRGASHITPGATYVLAANHASMFDIVALLAAVPCNVCFMMKRELTRVPIWGWGLIRSPYIVVNRSSLRDARRGMENAVKRLRERDRAVLFFPEGTRTRTGALQPFKRGAFSAAKSAGAPVVPITVNGSLPILPKGKFRINKGSIEVVIHAPVDSTKYDEAALMQCVEESIRKDYVEQ